MKDYGVKTPRTKHPTARAMEELKKNDERTARFQRVGNIVRRLKIVQIGLATHGRMGEQKRHPASYLPSAHSMFSMTTNAIDLLR